MTEPTTLEALYAAVPSLACQGRCGHSCVDTIQASAAERAALAARGVDLDAQAPGGDCPALSRTLVPTGSCTVYAKRPMVCRLWGVAASMPCPHGCIPDGGHLGDGAALDLLVRSMEAGGAAQPPAVRALLGAAMADPESAALLAALMRGNQMVKPALARALAALDL